MKRLTALTAVLILSACGGGGGGETTAPVVTASAEGFWKGTTALGSQVNLVILENGETWGLWGSSTSLVGALYGNTSSSGNTLSGSGTGFNLVTGTVGSGTYSGSFATKSSINLSVSDGTKLTGTYSSTYDQAASVATVAGTYTGWTGTGAVAGQTTAVAIDASGNVSSSFVFGSLICNTSGKATPRPSGKNIFNIQLTFTGNYCALGNGSTVNGVATYDSANRQFIAMGLNSAKSDGLIFIGTR